MTHHQGGQRFLGWLGAILLSMLCILGVDRVLAAPSNAPMSASITAQQTTIALAPDINELPLFRPSAQITTTLTNTLFLPVTLKLLTDEPPDPTLLCNPTNGAGGLPVGVHEVTLAGRPTTIIVGEGYDPAKPTYLAFYLHGDEGGYKFHTGSFSEINQFVNENSWIYVAPQAPPNSTGTSFPWDGSGGGSISGNGEQVKTVLDDMFSKYNVCRNIVFGGSVSGGSWFHDIYFFPQYGDQYPSFINIACGAAGIAEDRNFFGSYDKLVTLSQNPDIVARSEFKYTIGTDDFLYARALISVPTYQELSFSVIPDYLQDVGHCAFDTDASIRDYWRSKSATLNPPDK